MEQIQSGSKHPLENWFGRVFVRCPDQKHTGEPVEQKRQKVPRVLFSVCEQAPRVELDVPGDPVVRQRDRGPSKDLPLESLHIDLDEVGDESPFS